MSTNRTITIKLVVGAMAMILAGSARAQSSVTLYGLVDASLLYTSKTASSTGSNSGKQFSLADGGQSPSQFGITGTENLGDGLKVVFKLESGISMANGGFNNSNGNMFGRQSWIAMDGKFGEVKVGLQFSPFFLAAYDLDPRSFSQFGSGLMPYADNVYRTGIFNSNAVSYTSPVLGGFQGSALYALGGEAGNFQAGRQYSVGLKYDNGTLMVSASMYDGNGGGTVSTTPPTTVEFIGRVIGVSYKIGSLVAKASFTKYKVAGGFNTNVYAGGLDYFVLPQLDINGGVWFSSDRNQTANHALLAAIGANYLLSQRTTLYAQLGMVDNHGAMNVGLSVNNAFNGVAGTTVGASLGIRHVF
jgi:predicted porin